jgi:glycyl-tRNA synthetase beta chain
MAELFLELFSEEIPARMQARASEDLKRIVTDKLKEAGLAFTSASAYATPRRLALTVDGLPLAQPDVTEEKRGPRVGAPEQAVQGFLKSAGLASLDQCEKRDTGKGEFWFAVVKKKGVKTAALLPALLTGSFAALPWPKSMRWAGHQYRWVRPLHSIVATFDGALIEGAVDLGGSSIKFSCSTRGHRFLDPSEIKVAGFGDYKVKLREGYVIVDPAERRAAIKEQTDRLAAAEGLIVKPDDALLDEVTGLVEWPVALMGCIDEQFMDIPPEVLTTSMRVNQKYFSLLDKSSKLAPHFIVVANMQTKDGGKAIVAGNERVLRARLSDAKFFWDQDRKVKLEERVPALRDIVFHAKLGTVADKVSRMQTLAAELVPYIPGADVDQARSAALLAKADLTTGVVGEFPELQGVMGRYYAMHEGEKLAVADAIAEHYAPLGPNDRCPTAPVSVAVALADKIDSLVGFFAFDEKPTGSKDPFALRRAALGVIRLIVENGLRVPLLQVFKGSCDTITSSLLQERWRSRHEIMRQSGGQVEISHTMEARVAEKEEIASRVSNVPFELLDFFADRLKVALREKGVRHDLISAVFVLGGEDDLVRLLARVDALKRFLDSEDGSNLLVAYRRASNIVRIEEKKDGKTYNSGVDGALLRQEEEKALHRALAASGEAGVRALESEDFMGAMGALAQLRAPVDAFFDKVTVNCDEADLRANRLRLLSEIRTTLNRVADFSQIEG